MTRTSPWAVRSSPVGRAWSTACTPSWSICTIPPGSSEAIARDLEEIGGEIGWYGATWGWALRLVLGHLVGEHLRPRRPDRLVAGAAVDWWRVALSEPGELVLRSDGWFPGDAWLGYQVSGDVLHQVGSVPRRGHPRIRLLEAPGPGAPRRLRSHGPASRQQGRRAPVRGDMIRAIAAVDDRLGISTDTGIPWDVPADVTHFRELTTGATVLMGYATYAEFADAMPGRTNYVATRRPGNPRDGFFVSMICRFSPSSPGTSGSSAVPRSSQRRSPSWVKSTDPCRRGFRLYDSSRFDTMFRLIADDVPAAVEGVPAIRFQTWRRGESGACSRSAMTFAVSAPSTLQTIPNRRRMNRGPSRHLPEPMGNAEEAFEFYRSVFGTEYLGPVQRMGDRPFDPDGPALTDAEKQMVLHVELPILGGHVLVATDMVGSMGHELRIGNNTTINLEPDTRDKTQRLYDALSEGATDCAPLADMFWGATWGTCLDRFGVRWMFNFRTRGRAADRGQRTSKPA